MCWSVGLFTNFHSISLLGLLVDFSFKVAQNEILLNGKSYWCLIQRENELGIYERGVGNESLNKNQQVE